MTITGAPDELTAKVRAVVDVPDGTPLARVDLDDDRGRASKCVPEVAEVEVARGWPDTLAIDRDAAGAGRGDLGQRSVLAAGRHRRSVPRGRRHRRPG